MTQTFKVMAPVLAMLAAWCATADTEVVDGIEWTYTMDFGEVSVGGGWDATAVSTLTKGAITIPSALGGYPVTRIGYNAFYGCSGLTSVAIPSSVTHIVGGAFNGCSGLTSVAIPSSVTHIVDGAFNGCSGITKFVVDPQNENYMAANGLLLSKDGKTLIAGINNVSVVIPDGVTNICGYAFSECNELVNVAIPESVTAIDNFAFQNCYSLLRIVIPSKVSSIGSGAFDRSYNLSSVNDVEFLGGNVVLGANSFSGWNCATFHAQPPSNIMASGLADVEYVYYPKKYAAKYSAFFGESVFAGYTDTGSCSVEVKSAKMRSEDPTVMDVTFRVTSSSPTVKVRALAFENGTRSLLNAVRIKSFVSDSSAAIGDAIAANEDHMFSWKVNNDFTNAIAKLSVEVMAVEEGPLTFEFVSIPAIGAQPALTIARNAIASCAMQDAAFWVFADKSSTLRFEVCKLEWSNEFRVYDEESLVSSREFYYGMDEEFGFVSAMAPIVLQKLGYGVTTEDQLAYAREKTGYSLNSWRGPYAVKK